MANLRALVKDAGAAPAAGWTQSSSATSGITAYGNTGKKVRLRGKVRKNAVALLELLKVRDRQ